MDNKLTKDSQTKPRKDNKHTAIRSTKSTASKLKKILALANKKDHGSVIKMEDLLTKIATEIDQKFIQELQEESLSEEDKFKRDYNEYCSHNGKISMDEFFKLVRQGTIFQGQKM